MTVTLVAGAIAGALPNAVKKVPGGDAVASDVQTDIAAALAAVDAAAALLVTALGTITYSATTHQFSGTLADPVGTVTATNGNAAVASFNTAFTALKNCGASGVLPGHVSVEADANLSPQAVKDAVSKIVQSLSLLGANP